MLVAIFLFYSKSDAQNSAAKNPEWIYTTSNENLTTYLQSYYVSKDGSQVKIWTKWVYKKSYTYNGKVYNNFWNKQLEIWDCTKKQHKNIITAYYDGDEPIDSDMSGGEWMNVNTNTLGEDILKMVDKMFN